MRLTALRAATLPLLLLTSLACHAQWDLQDAHSTADLRGIAYVGNGVAWASGTNGTVLRTEDLGFVWQLCATPPGAEKLDFRGIQAFDNNTAVVMSSGKGDLSRLYKTTDGCQTWKLVFTNPDAPGGFFDAILFLDPQHGILLGDPITSPPVTPARADGAFVLRVTANGGKTWGWVSDPGDGDCRDLCQEKGLFALSGESAFAASNSSVSSSGDGLWFATSKSRIARHMLLEGGIGRQFLFQSTYCAGSIDAVSGECGQPWSDLQSSFAPVQHEKPSAGIFSLHFASSKLGIAVGGDYLKPNDPQKTAAFSADGGLHWTAATTPPHGYRSAVAYDPKSNTWITVGPNGTDISADDGRNWRPLKPNTQAGELPDADIHWNALSLPFVVGPHGRIGLLRQDALPTPARAAAAKALPKAGAK